MQGRAWGRQYLVLAVVTLVVVNVLIFRAALTPRVLTVAVLDIGQGDAIFVRGPTGITMLVDGGPDRSVLRELGAMLPIGERAIDVIIETHPDKDHIGGLPDVFMNYEVKNFLEPGISNDTNAAAALAEAASAESGVNHVIARRGMRLDLGGGAYADILYPDRDPSKLETNFGAVVMRLSYGKTSFMLTADMPSQIEDWLLVLDKNDGELLVDVLKVAHHGSKYSTNAAWLAATSPSIAAISVGAHNSYGHPTLEVLSRVLSEGATVYRTDQEGRLIFTSDGATIHKK
ncbi:MAG: MBL fold metallo-hydrolase [bacterium]|nr:MBL fold metallo-hydrolase [bacterium]